MTIPILDLTSLCGINGPNSALQSFPWSLNLIVRKEDGALRRIGHDSSSCAQRQMALTQADNALKSVCQGKPLILGRVRVRVSKVVNRSQEVLHG